MFYCNICGAGTPEECHKRHAERDRDIDAMERGEEALYALKDVQKNNRHGALVEHIETALEATREYVFQITRIVDRGFQLPPTAPPEEEEEK